MTHSLKQIVPVPVRRRIRRTLTELRMGSMEKYFDRLAPTYDEWWLGTGRCSGPEYMRPGWHEEVQRLLDILEGFEPARTLDIACGTGLLTARLPGEIVGLDMSEPMLAIARQQAPGVTFVRGDALALPFADGSFERVFMSCLYGVVEAEKQGQLIAEARRVSPELVLIDGAIREGLRPEEQQVRRLEDGSNYTLYKHYYTAEKLAEEIGSAEVLHDGRYFVMVRSVAPGKQIAQSESADRS
jgi:ubiquinone/menaquinone biosynthesis C-methylase UbiE